MWGSVFEPPKKNILFGSAFRGSKLTPILTRYDWRMTWMSRGFWPFFPWPSPGSKPKRNGNAQLGGRGAPGWVHVSSDRMGPRIVKMTPKNMKQIPQMMVKNCVLPIKMCKGRWGRWRIIPAFLFPRPGGSCRSWTPYQMAYINGLWSGGFTI